MVSPCLMSNDTPFTACIVLPESRKSTASSRPERSSLMTGLPGAGFSVSGCLSSSWSFCGLLLLHRFRAQFGGGARPRRRPDGLSWIEGVTHRLADEDQQAQHDGEREESRQAQPG